MLATALYFGDDALDIEKEVARAKSGSIVETEDFTAKLKDIRVRVTYPFCLLELVVADFRDGLGRLR
jgi:hypothetical protein